MYDWVLRLTRIDDEGKKTVVYVDCFDTTAEKIAAIADDYLKHYAVVRVYKLQVVL